MTTLVLPVLRNVGALFARDTRSNVNLLDRLAQTLARSGAIEPFGL